jgi:ribose/xylose/arabinose/galactoside ABC-type transport system permease subunit
MHSVGSTQNTATSPRSVWLDQALRLVTASSLHAASIRIAALVLLTAACLLVPHFTEFANLQALSYTIAPVGIGAVGMALVTLNGNLFMLSMGATAAVSTVLFASVLHIGLLFSLVAVTGAGIAIGLVQGVLIASAGANPIITTIAASSMITGAGVLWTGGLTVVGEGDASWLGSGQLIGWVPNQILVLAVFALISGFVLERGRIGRELRLTGMQRNVARVAGLRLVAATLVAYGFAGAAAGLAGGVIASSAARGNLTYGTDLDFNAIAAVLVGGISINGGRGRISDAVVGAVFLGVISNILLVSGVSYEFQLMVKGLVVLGAVVFGVFAARTARR